MSAIYVTGISRCRKIESRCICWTPQSCTTFAKYANLFAKTIKLLKYTFHDAVNNAIGVAFDCVWVCVSNVVETP